jgi:hypothetical protein
VFLDAADASDRFDHHPCANLFSLGSSEQHLHRRGRTDLFKLTILKDIT